MSASIPFLGNVFQEIFSVHFVLAPSVPLAIVSPCPLLSSRMGGTTIILSFLSLLPTAFCPLCYGARTLPSARTGFPWTRLQPGHHRTQVLPQAHGQSKTVADQGDNQHTRLMQEVVVVLRRHIGRYTERDH